MRRGLWGVLALAMAIVALVVWWLVSQAAQAPVGEAPVREVLAEPPPPVGVSRIALTARIPLSELEDLVEEKVPPVVVDAKGEPAKGDWRYDLTVRREQDVVIRGDAQGRLVLQVPLVVDAKTYSGRKADRRERKGKEAPQGIRLDAGVELTLTIDYGIDAQWNAQPRIELTHRWTGDPRLKLGPLSFKVRGPVDKKLGSKLAEAATAIEAKMMEQDTLRARLEQTWAELHQPRLTDKGDGWLVMAPKQLAMSAPKVVDGALEIPFAIQTTLRVVSGDKPEPTPLTPLPTRTDPTGADGVEVAAELRLEWEALEQRTAASLQGRTWESELGTLSVGRVQLYPSGDRIALGLDLLADNAGVQTPATVWFLGRPVLDRAAETVRIEDFDYAVQADGGWLETANHATLRTTLRDQVQPSLVFPYGDAAKTKLDDVGGQRGEKDFEMTIDAFDVERMNLAQDALVVQLSLTGAASLDIDVGGGG